ncbi:M28 family peptidase [Hugenholtzia roseola]|uniref:M28 family peptidase n=1 Tax=Hugenholtzia roseola TaxID=1002 RepID=UPI00040E31B4|nr:M28 family peptidase [Hugenholtzia roseola]
MQQLFLSFRLLFLMSLPFLWACEKNNQTSQENKTTQNSTTPQKTRAVPAFDADSAFFFVEKQLSFGTRQPNSEGHRKTGDYLIETLKSYGAEVTVQDLDLTAHDGKRLQGRNIFAALYPENKRRILLAAHWDTRPQAENDKERPKEPILGANDGASGVAVLLELVRTLQSAAEKPAVGIDIALFDLEDYGESAYKDSYCLGSQYWAKNPHKPNYTAYYGILLDMVGAKNAIFGLEGVSMEFAPSIMNKVWTKAEMLGYGAYFRRIQTGHIIDDHYYVNTLAKIPMIDIIQHDPENGDSYFAPHWHTHQDNLDIIDRETLKAVGTTVLHVLYEEEVVLQ